MYNFQFFGESLSRIGQISSEETIETAYFDLNKGVARLDYANGDCYLGNIDPKNLHREGFGLYKFKNGGYYEGEFHGNEFEGLGMMDCIKTKMFFTVFLNLASSMVLDVTNTPQA